MAFEETVNFKSMGYLPFRHGVLSFSAPLPSCDVTRCLKQVLTGGGWWLTASFISCLVFRRARCMWIVCVCLWLSVRGRWRYGASASVWRGVVEADVPFHSDVPLHSKLIISALVSLGGANWKHFKASCWEHMASVLVLGSRASRLWSFVVVATAIVM